MIGVGTRILLFRKKKWEEASIVDVTPTIFSSIIYRNENDFEILPINRKPDWINLVNNKTVKIIEAKDESKAVLANTKIGTKLTIKYQKKWYNAVIDKLEDNSVTLKLYKSIFKIKTVEIERSTYWKYLIYHRIIIFQCLFPDWVGVGRCIWWYNNFVYYPAKILKYKDGKSITIFYIGEYIDNIASKVCIHTVKYKNFKKSEDCGELINTDGYVDVICDCYHRFDDLENKELLQYLWSKQKESDSEIPQKSNNKSTDKQVMPSPNKFKSVRYQEVLTCDIFPISVNEIIFSFLQHRLLYVCPPTGSMIRTKPIEWQRYPYAELGMANTRSAVVGIEFEMNDTDILDVKGIELPECDFINPSKNKVHLIRYFSQIQFGQDKFMKVSKHTASMQPGGHNQFLFENPVKLQQTNAVNDKFLYRLIIDIEEITKLYNWHNMGRNKLNILTQTNFKCFYRISWLQFNDKWESSGFMKKRCKNGTAATMFPHVGFIL